MVTHHCDHLIIPAIYLKLKAHDKLAHLASARNPSVPELVEGNRQRNQQILKQFDDITAILNKENIQPVFLKGTGNLLDGLYNDVGERMIGDIDFLVKEEDFLKTAKLLLKHGYCDQLKIDGDEITTPAHHYSVLTKKDAPAAVEIHRVPVDVKYARHFTSEIVFCQRKKIEDKENTYVPTDTHKLIHNFIHSQLSHAGHRE